jgi:hypothetical protein
MPAVAGMTRRGHDKSKSRAVGMTVSDFACANRAAHIFFRLRNPLHFQRDRKLAAAKAGAARARDPVCELTHGENGGIHHAIWCFAPGRNVYPAPGFAFRCRRIRRNRLVTRAR